MYNPEDLIGKQIDAYKIDQFISEDAMGSIYKALDPARNHTVALRLISKSEDITPAGSDFRTRFIEIAQASARLSHGNIITVLAYGETEDFQYIAMEYAGGQTLAEILAKRVMLPVEETIPVFMQVLTALEVAAAEHVVHMNINPACILITEGNRVKVMNFGIARQGHLFTMANSPYPGAPFYMSPEQIRGEKGDTRSDIFSLGAVFYHTLTGSRPFEGESIISLTDRILHTKPLAPGTLNDHIPKEVEAIILKAISKDPSQRYQTPSEMKEDLHSLSKEPLEETQPDVIVDREPVQKPIPVAFERAGELSDDPAFISFPETSDEPASEDELSLDFLPDAQASLDKEKPLPDKLWSILGFLVVGAFALLIFLPSHPAPRQAAVDPWQPPRPTERATPQSPQVQYEMGRKYLNGTGVKKDPAEALQWFQKSAAQGHAPAQNSLGSLYGRGEGVERNDREAVQWYRKAAEQENPLGQCNLGTMYLNGLGVEKNYQEALQ
jgi:serine/threonine protein kinase